MKTSDDFNMRTDLPQVDEPDPIWFAETGGRFYVQQADHMGEKAILLRIGETEGALLISADTADRLAARLAAAAKLSRGDAG